MKMYKMNLFTGGMCSEAEHQLFSTIFSNYNQYIRPVENVSDPVIVQFEVSMSQLVKVVSKIQGEIRLVYTQIAL